MLLPKLPLAHWILSQVTHPDRAAAILGDLLEQSEANGPLWFWSSTLRIAISLQARRLTSQARYSAAKSARFALELGTSLLSAAFFTAMPLLVIGLFVRGVLGGTHEFPFGFRFLAEGQLHLRDMELWLLCVTANGLVAGLTVGLLVKRRNWSETRLRLILSMASLAVQISFGSIATFAFHAQPFGWIAPWAETFIAQMMWLSLAGLITERIADALRHRSPTQPA